MSISLDGAVALTGLLDLSLETAHFILCQTGALFFQGGKSMKDRLHRLYLGCESCFFMCRQVSEAGLYRLIEMINFLCQTGPLFQDSAQSLYGIGLQGLELLFPEFFQPV